MTRILIIDDEKAILGLLSLSFRREGYEVITAMSGEQALAICETDSFDAVLSDVSMPGIDGHQTVSRIRARTPAVVSVLMSGFHIDCTGSCRVQTRHCMWLQKPFAPRLAVSTVARLLEVQRASLVS
jgi:DNA-binding NtrC family response regulator